MHIAPYVCVIAKVGHFSYHLFKHKMTGQNSCYLTITVIAPLYGLKQIGKLSKTTFAFEKHANMAQKSYV